jgi:peptide/nickel transport system permease protein
MHNPQSPSLIDLIKQYLRQGDTNRARLVAQHLTARHPEIVEGWLFLAGLCAPEDRMTYLAKAQEISPHDPRVIKALAWATSHTEGKRPEPELARPPHTPKDETQPLRVDGPSQETSRVQPSWLTRISQNGFFRGFIHMGKKAILIALTIFIGTFVTIQIMNRPVVIGFSTAPPQLDTLVEKRIQEEISQFYKENSFILDLSEEEQAVIDAELRATLNADFGLDQPRFQRHLQWTINALTFNWGRLRVGEQTRAGIFRIQKFVNLNQIILEYLPNTLLLVCTAYLFAFLIGLPLALIMSSNYGKWYDKIFSFFAAFSSIPSWVYGIILIAIFALELRLLPTGRMVGNLPPETRWGYITVVARHMVLPVAAIFLSIFFNLVYSWRTFFLTFSEEDYVELGKATGISNRKLQRDYILKPSLPFVITSFSLLFVTFWQMTLALEVVFDWPGLGWLYVIRGLPNLWGESAYPGDLVISISLVVMFAYLMGSIVLILDLVYVIVDPRIRLSKGSKSLRLKKRKGQLLQAFKGLFQAKKEKPEKSSLNRNGSNWHHDSPRTRADGPLPTLVRFKFWKWFKRAVAEVTRYPSAIIGFTIIGLLIIGSLYAVIFLPFEKIGDDWTQSSFTGQPKTPKLAKPAWTNLFIKGDYLSTLIFDSQQGDGDYAFIPLNGETNNAILTFNFDYNYAAFPSEIFLYLSSNFESKRGFASIYWRTPDGRELELKTTEVSNLTYYDFEDGIPYRHWVQDNPNWAAWFNTSDITQNSPHYLLFADPNQPIPKVLHGQYELVIDGFTFEEDSQIQAELVMLGQVYGPAGTDFWRRDLIVPLLWGMPFALLIGLGGALFTTIISMAMAATGVWFGGWVDNLVQRLIDVNLVLPILAIAVMAYAFLGISVWTILIVYVFLNAFGTPTKTFRAAFLQIKDAPYIEAAKSYGAKNTRIIVKYMIPRLIPVLVPQLVILIPAFVFLEATLGFFNIRMLYPTWGTVIYQAATRGGIFGSRFWMLQPIALLLLTGLGFSLFGLALERILNPRLSDD